MTCREGGGSENYQRYCPPLRIDNFLQILTVNQFIRIPKKLSDHSIIADISAIR